MNPKNITLLFFLVISLYSCKKKSTNDPVNPQESLVITDGSTCKFINASGRNDVTLGFPRNSDRQKTTGTVKVAVIFVDFSDSRAAVNPEQVFATMSPSSENFLTKVSHSKLNIVFEPKFKWYRMSKLSTGYSGTNLSFYDHKAFIQEAVSLADVDYDFTNTDQILIMTHPGARALSRTSAFIGQFNTGISADGRIITNAITGMSDVLVSGSGFWFPHEFGHSMGAPDLYAYNGPTQGYVGDFSVMSSGWGKGPTYNAWEQWLFGWFNDSQVTCVRGSGTGKLQLTPVAQADGMKLLVLPLSETSAVIVEDRRRIDYDNQLPKEGPLVYLIDTKIANGEGSLKVLPIDPTDQIKTNAPLSVDQSITYGNITVKCIASGAAGSTIAYERK